MGETLRGTINSTVDQRFGGSAHAADKNQAALDTGRYEREHRQFYHHPDDVGQPQYAAPPPPSEPSSASTSPEFADYGAASGGGWAAGPGGPGQQPAAGGGADPQRNSAGGLRELFNRATARPLSRISEADSVESGSRPRKLRKRSSSRGGVVQE